MKKLLILFTCITLLCGCSKIANMPKNPARPPRDGYSWKIQTGLGLKFYGQENKNTRFVFDQNLSTVSIETTAANKKNIFPVIRIFDITNKNPKSVKAKLKNIAPELSKSTITTKTKYDNIDLCEFKEIETTRPGVIRFILYPAGAAEQEFLYAASKEAIPSTCTGFGCGNSGMRYFEIQNKNPNKLLFIEIGQEQPLFDENSITVTK